MTITTTANPDGTTAAPAPVDARRAELVAELRSLAALIESRPDLEIARYGEALSLRMATLTREGLSTWAETFDAEVKYQPYEVAKVIPYIDHRASALLRLSMQSPAEANPYPDERDQEIARLRAALAAAGAGKAVAR